ncbi:MAG: ATP-binding cassette domain-containing protein [Actinomycetales bacterium]|nr:ATP-binding cassette domain-containing protein [Actinomycetales bacterium]
MSLAIEVSGLQKNFGEVQALRGIDFTVEQGTIVGLLGPNGSGKTTTVRILATLLKADGGSAKVGGFEVSTNPTQVKNMIGLTGQYAAVDEYLTGRENLQLFGQLFHLSKNQAAQRADELLHRFDLADAADRGIKGYSGGMRRRLDLAASLIGHPAVLFLDEPTTGLDPRSRLGMWEVIESLVAGGTTVLLTTQYLEEADQLASRSVVLDHGSVIAQGTSDELKSQVGGDRVELVVEPTTSLDQARQTLAPIASGEINVYLDEHKVVVPTSGGSRSVVEAVRLLDEQQIPIVDIALRRPTLDDVFLSLTGKTAEENETEDAGKKKSSRRGNRK